MKRTPLLLVIATLTTACTDYEITAKTDAPGLDSGSIDGPDDTGGPEPVTGDGAVAGRICTPSGGGYVVGADVWTLDSAGARHATTTGSDGSFTLTGLALGTYLIHVEKGSFETSFEVEVVTEDEVTVLAFDECLDPDSVNIAVVTGEYDDIGELISDMGFDYTEYRGVRSTVFLDLLTDSALMATYDIIFLNCGISDDWLAVKDTVAANIAAYVEGGGSVYTSDWAYYFFEAAYPSAVEFYGDDARSGTAYVGSPGELTGYVQDPALEAVLGTNVAALNYNLVLWAVPESVAEGVDTLIEGPAPVYYGGVVTGSPLALRMNRGGKALFTSFHNEAQTTGDMELILEEIILSL